MGAPEFRPPALTTKAQREAEELAARADYWLTAKALLDSREWPEGYFPEDALDLARFLADEDN